MKKWLIVCLLLVPSASWAQHVGDKELTGQIGYQYWGTQTFVNSFGYPAGDVHVNAALTYGGLLSLFIRDYYAAEIQYSYSTGDLIARPEGPFGDTKIADLATQYIQVYGTRFVPVKPDKMDAFVMGGLGATGYSASGFDSRWLFSFGVGLGLKIHTNEKMSIRIQQRFLVPVQWGEGGFYFGTGGAGVSVGGGSSIIQGDTSLGLVLKLGS